GVQRVNPADSSPACRAGCSPKLEKVISVSGLSLMDGILCAAHGRAVCPEATPGPLGSPRCGAMRRCAATQTGWEVLQAACRALALAWAAPASQTALETGRRRRARSRGLADHGRVGRPEFPDPGSRTGGP